MRKVAFQPGKPLNIKLRSVILNENGKMYYLELLEIVEIFTKKWGRLVQKVENSFRCVHSDLFFDICNLILFKFFFNFE